MLEADGIVVYCSYTEIVDIASLVPNPRNPNQHPDKQIHLLARIIKEHGWRVPITVSNRSGFIVRGHARLMAAQLLGVTKVPIDRQDYISDDAELADLIADNQIAELSAFNPAMLMDLLEELNTGDFDMELTGFTETDIEQLVTKFGIPDTEFKEYDEDIEKDVKKVVCPHCGGEVPI